ncbi:MAG: HAD family phosphatase, partial [Candidatus Diapherotrites archaeon]|nr:HAD family phosphatase [Candidatus Diapherotrites archaeon]
KAKLFPDAVEVVKYLKGKGFKLGIGSGSAHDSLMRVLGSLSSEFDAIVDAGTPVTPKPSPELFLEVAKELGVEPYECAVVEDAFLGIKAAESAEMLPIAVTSGYFTKSEVWLAEPNFIIDSLSDLKKLFKDCPQEFS